MNGIRKRVGLFVDRYMRSLGTYGKRDLRFGESCCGDHAELSAFVFIFLGSAIGKRMVTIGALGTGALIGASGILLDMIVI